LFQKRTPPLPPLGVEGIGIWQNFVSKKNTPLTPSGGRGDRHIAELCFKKEHTSTPRGVEGLGICQNFVSKKNTP